MTTEASRPKSAVSSMQVPRHFRQVARCSPFCFQFLRIPRNGPAFVQKCCLLMHQRAMSLFSRLLVAFRSLFCRFSVAFRFAKRTFLCGSFVPFAERKATSLQTDTGGYRLPLTGEPSTVSIWLFVSESPKRSKSRNVQITCLSRFTSINCGFDSPA